MPKPNDMVIERNMYVENERDGFTEKLKKLVELGNSKKGILEVEEINDFFKNENLSLEQLEYIYQYLEDNKIDVLLHIVRIEQIRVFEVRICFLSH